MSLTLAADITKYLRTQTVGNEQQGIATFLTYMTAHLPNPRSIQSAILTGSRSSGKTQLQDAIAGLFPSGTVFRTSAGSPKAFIYDDEMQKSKYLVFSELQKLTPEWIEFLKSMSGDDPDFTYRVTVKNLSGRGPPFRTTKITLKKSPYTITSAQDIKDVELLSRLLTIPTDESVELNKAVALWQLGVKEVTFKDTVYKKVGFKEHEMLRNPITTALHSLIKQNDGHGCPEVDIPDCFAHTAVTFLDVRNVSSRRHAKIVASLMKTSALVERENREKTLFGNRIRAGAQDLLNIITLQPVLSTTILDIDERARTLYEILESNGQEGMSAEDVQRALADTKMSSLSLTTIRAQLKKLADSGAVEINTADRGRHIYFPVLLRKVKDIEIDYDLILKEDGSSVQDPLTGIEHGNFEDAVEDMKRRIPSLGVKKAQESLNGFV